MPRRRQRDIKKFFRVGGQLQTKSIKGSPQGQGLLQTPNPGQVKVVQEGTKRAEEEQPTLLERMTADNRTTRKTGQEPKNKKSVHGREASKLNIGNWGAAHGPPVQGNLIDDSKAKASLQGKRHNDAGESGIKLWQTLAKMNDAPPTRRTTMGVTSPTGNLSTDSTQDQDSDSLADPNPTIARYPEPTPSPAQARQRVNQALNKRFQWYQLYPFLKTGENRKTIQKGLNQRPQGDSISNH